MADIAVFRLWNGQDLPGEIDILPLHAELLPRTQSGVDADQEGGKLFRAVFLNIPNHSFFFFVRKEANSCVVLGLFLNPRRRIDGDLLVFDSYSEDKGKRRLPSV